MDIFKNIANKIEQKTISTIKDLINDLEVIFKWIFKYIIKLDNFTENLVSNLWTLLKLGFYIGIIGIITNTINYFFNLIKIFLDITNYTNNFISDIIFNIFLLIPSILSIKKIKELIDIKIGKSKLIPDFKIFDNFFNSFIIKQIKNFIYIFLKY